MSSWHLAWPMPSKHECVCEWVNEICSVKVPVKEWAEDYKGAIVDYSQAILLRVDYYKAYNNRGFAKLLLEDYSGAIADFTSTIKYDNYNTEFSSMALGNRGVSKLAIGQDGCADMKKAIELGNKNIVETYITYCK